MLELTLVCVGRSKAGPERDLAVRYIERTRPIARSLGFSLEIREVIESRAKRPFERQADEGGKLRDIFGVALAQAIVFDEGGEHLDSQSFAGMIRLAIDQGVRSLPLIIGGPDGLDSSIREAAKKVIAFGQMTWPHQLVRVMAVEQIYRAATILSGHPYHRA